MDQLLYFVPAMGVIALIYAGVLARRVRAADPGNERMQELGKAINEGAMAFLNREYRSLILFVIVVAVGLVFAIGLLLLGALAGVTFTISIYYSLYTTGPGGRRTGIHEAIVGSGFLVGPLAGGLIAEHLGARAPYWVSAGVICCVVFAQVAILNKKPTRELMPQAGD